jgi:hypothetical protein
MMFSYMKVCHISLELKWKHTQKYKPHTQNGDAVFADLLKEGKLTNYGKTSLSVVETPIF